MLNQQRSQFIKNCSPKNRCKHPLGFNYTIFLNFERCYVLYFKTVPIQCDWRNRISKSKGERELKCVLNEAIFTKYKYWNAGLVLFVFISLKRRSNYRFEKLLGKRNESVHNIHKHKNSHTHMRAHTSLVWFRSLAFAHIHSLARSASEPVSHSSTHEYTFRSNTIPFLFNIYIIQTVHQNHLKVLDHRGTVPSHLQWICYLFDCGNASIFHYVHSTRR